jgi:hypothetical protein
VPTSDSLSWRKQDSAGNPGYWARLDCYHVFRRKSLFRLLEENGFAPCSYSASEIDPIGMAVIACKQ